MEPFLGEIRVFSFPKVPNGWLACNGATLNIQQYTALYALIGIQFGGNGTTTFNLPNLQGAVIIGSGTSAANPPGIKTGGTTGSETVVLTTATTPAHAHQVNVSTVVGNAGLANGYLTEMQVFTTTNTSPLYTVNSYIPATGNTTAPIQPITLPADTISTVGANAGHQNMSPYQVLNVCIATTGDFPPRN